MKSGTKLRVIISIIATPFLVVGYLNIEKLAEKKGWDGILSGWVDKMPDGLSGFIVSPFMAMLSAFIVGIVVGLWVDTLLRAKNVKRTNMQILGHRMSKLTSLITKKMQLNNLAFNNQNFAEEYSASLMLVQNAKKMKMSVPDLNGENWEADLEEMVKYFRLMNPRLVADDRKSVINFSKTIIKPRLN